MASKSVRIEGLDEVVDSFRRADGILNRQGRSFLREMGIYGVERAQIHILNEGAVDTNELIQGMNYEVNNTTTGLEAVVKPSTLADKYAAPVEYGSKPHSAPIDALQGWADRHGIPVGAVWYSIKTKGTQPRWVFRDTFEDVQQKVDSEIPDFIDSILRQL